MESISYYYINICSGCFFNAFLIWECHAYNFFDNPLSPVCASHILMVMRASTGARWGPKENWASWSLQMSLAPWLQEEFLSPRPTPSRNGNRLDLAQVLCRQPCCRVHECTGPAVSRRHGFTPVLSFWLLRLSVPSSSRVPEHWGKELGYMGNVAEHSTDT